MKIKRRYLIYISVAIIAIALFLMGISYIGEYRPEPKEVICENMLPTPLPDTLTILAWNIGYAGLGDNMDFFYDGGERVRDSRERTEENLSGIISVLKKADADIMLLQEVDVRSHRTYRINELDSLKAAFPDYEAAFGYNFKVWFVPIPMKNPIGRVSGGIVTLSRFKPLDVVRYDYPSHFSMPQRMFNLKRCLLSSRYLLYSGDTLTVNNTHNTAYDAGGMRRREMQFLSDTLLKEAALGTRSVTGGDWNQYPPDYKPSEGELKNEFFVPQRIDPELFRSFADFYYPQNAHTLRYLDEPYKKGNVTTLTDFFLVSRGIRVLSVEALDMGFRFSDHNPVVIKIAL